MKPYIGLLLLLITLASCRISKPYQQPEFDTGKLYRDAEGRDTTNIVSVHWNKFFGDTILTGLIAEGLSRNIDMKIALQRIDAARANFQQSKAAFLPDLNGNASIKQSKLAFPQGFGLINSSTQYDIGLSASWEADIWGKLKSTKRSALAGLLQTEEARKAVQTQLIADIANRYFTLLALDQQLQVLEQTVNNRKTDVRTMKALKAANIVNGAAEVQSEASQYAAEVAVPRLKKQIRETENALNILLARPPSAIYRSSLDEQQLLIDLKAGIPAQLLQNRPDIKQAEYAFMAAFENTNAARKLFYPSFNLTAAGGFTSFSLKDWLTPDGLFGNIAAGLAQPIFNKGLNKARLITARTVQQEAALNFQQFLLKAGEEVSNALFAYQTAKTQQEIRVKQLAALQKSVDFTKKLLRYSSATNYTDVLTSEQNLLSAQMEDIDDKLQQWQAVIALYRSLGGGSEN
ncbi:efflux transporter outer membrane subunit [Pedobacter heparinus]|uniref:RND efflux system, outer membrane lipoprotein, NodT family n=1 Tax=Pedobacter heparinus (strain ATCC 13125 / DSM 2366 / CIP 104194 / JCM 7457 / NBRC 12017 / NCIMB 9290 / NRRL B-14731 / HIM 762-3) TaxID=485917 RepID=C6XSC0_PEDHD|nr:efflux transporter outer membrane subunit [Pedobacter heparinus]ACU03465.1 RND efflux system, outer membrane lipoprotein, NodT family [Pedobacter heparinus DSM 2366]